MGEISNVDSDKIMSCANKMESEVANVQSGVTMFREAVTKLESTWVGESKIAFMQSFERDSEAMVEMVEQMREICDQLKQMANSYSSNESNIQGKLRSLR